MRTDELDYHLPASLIATHPVEPRDHARLLVFDPASGAIEHRHVRDLPQYLHAGDAVVFNTTRVEPARLIGWRSDTRGRVEGLYLGDAVSTADVVWELMLKSNSVLRAGQRITLVDRADRASSFELELLDRSGPHWLARLLGAASTRDALEQVGRTPLPPYILRARNEAAERAWDDDRDRAWYQTTFAASEHGGSVAAPTAGLHFTPSLLADLTARGIERIDVSLQVGIGTFKPITTDTLEAHPMHSERYFVPGAARAALHNAKARGGRIIAIGTTSVRTLESLPDESLPDDAPPGDLVGDTSLLIAPGYRWRVVDGLMTNFHLPRSTLLALVAAKIGLDAMRRVYDEAIRDGYRFYSYGDAMLILP